MAQTHKERKEAIKKAERVDILSVAQQLGMGLNRQGKTYLWEEHDSLIITPKKNMFYWNAQGRGGGPIQLVQMVKGCSYKKAINFIADSNLEDFKEIAEPKVNFRYFVKEHEDITKTKEYLVKERQLSYQTVDFFVENNVVAQGMYRVKESGHEETAIIFKHFDEKNNIKGISYQGIDAFPEIHGVNKPRLKRTMGDGFYGLSVTIGNVPNGATISEEQPLKIVAFESPIDLMSYYELKHDTLKDVVLLSMNGLRKGTISKYIANTLGSNIKEEKKATMLDDMQKQTKDTTSSIQVTLAVDNDEAGRKFVGDFNINFIEVKSDFPPLSEGKEKADWNDFLVSQSNINGQSFLSEETPQPRKRLDISRGKLDRLENEFDSKVEKVYSHASKTNGQPMNDKRKGYQHMNQQKKKEEAVFKKLHEVEEQRERVEKLEYQASLKEMGFNRFGGLDITIENIPRVKKEIELSNKGKSTISRATIKKYEKQLATLESQQMRFQEASLLMDQSTQSLIQSEELAQWNKDPMLFFVKGQQKLALELTTTGKLIQSTKYAPQTDEAKQVVTTLLNEMGALQMEEKITNEELSNYYVVEFNERGELDGVRDFKGEKVTTDLIKEIKQLDTEKARLQEEGFYKFYFDEIKNGEVINHFRMDVGDGVHSNHKYYQELESKAITVEKQSDLEHPTKEVAKELSSDIRTLEDNPVNKKQSVADEVVLSKERKVVEVPYNVNYLDPVQEIMDQQLNEIAQYIPPVKNYITEDELKKLLSAHLDKVEGLVKTYTESIEYLERPTEQQKEALNRGFFDTMKDFTKQFKDSLVLSVKTKRDNAISNVVGRMNAIKYDISNAFSSRILRINQSIQNFVDKVDLKFNKDRDKKLTQNNEQLNHEKKEQNQGLSPDKIDFPKNDLTRINTNEKMIELGRTFMTLTEEKVTLESVIRQTVTENPLADLSKLQAQLKLNQEETELIQKELTDIRQPYNPDVTIESSLSNVEKLSVLISHRDQLISKRNEWVNHPDFLQQKDTKETNTPLVQFKLADEEIKKMDDLIVEIKEGKDVNLEETIGASQAKDAIKEKEVQTKIDSNNSLKAPTKSNLTPDELEKLNDVVQSNRASLLQPETFKKYLESASNFHDYSYKNIQMIMAQDPQSTQVASENKWKKLGYELKENAEPIHVYAPSFIDKENPTKDNLSFYLKPVFDVSQTTGEGKIQTFNFNPTDTNQFANITLGLSEHIKNNDVRMKLHSNLGNQSLNDIIKNHIDASINELIASRPEGQLKEFERNAISYGVASRLGLDMKESYSLEGLSQFNNSSSSMKQLNSSLDRISKNTNKLIDSIENKLVTKKSINKFQERVNEGIRKNKEVSKNTPSQSKEQTVAKTI